MGSLRGRSFEVRLGFPRIGWSDLRSLRVPVPWVLPRGRLHPIQHSMLTAIWHMGTTGTLYDDLGGDYFTRRHPDRAKNRAIHQLEAMGYRVTLDHAS